MVSDLIDSSLGVWKVDLVRQIFFTHTTLGFPLSDLLPDDSLIWNSIANDIFFFSWKWAYNYKLAIHFRRLYILFPLHASFLSHEGGPHIYPLHAYFLSHEGGPGVHPHVRERMHATET